ncbi:hypothetical protein C8J57DRAFT_1354413 [Mycena rebaudengoi]|nr:hypothetical protein C8J57DRAFT_1354413 [Mycena rebaudengoi]
MARRVPYFMAFRETLLGLPPDVEFEPSIQPAILWLFVDCWRFATAVLAMRRRIGRRIRRVGRCLVRKAIFFVFQVLVALVYCDYMSLLKSHMNMLLMVFSIYLRPLTLLWVWDSLFCATVSVFVVPYLYKGISRLSLHKVLKVVDLAYVVDTYGKMLVILAGVRLRPDDFDLISRGTLCAAFVVFAVPYVCRALAPASLRKAFLLMKPILLEFGWNLVVFAELMVMLVDLHVLPAAVHLVLDEVLCALAPSICISHMVAICQFFRPIRPAPLPRQRKRWYRPKG